MHMCVGGGIKNNVNFQTNLDPNRQKHIKPD